MPDGLNVQEMLCGDFNRMRYTFRYAGSKVNDRESDATHTYFVVMYADLIASWCNQYTKYRVNHLTVLRRALWHDIDEAWSGDMPREFKRSSPALGDLLLAVCAGLVDNGARRVFNGDTELSRGLVVPWMQQKHHDREGCIVGLADFLAVVSYVWLECDGDYSRRRFMHADDMWGHFHGFDRAQFEFLRPILDEVEQIIELMYGPEHPGLTREEFLGEIPDEHITIKHSTGEEDGER